MYKAPEIISGSGVVRLLRDLKGRVLVCTMEIPWRLAQESLQWTPDQVHMVADMDKATVEALHETLPPCDVVVGIGGGSCCDSAKYLAWKRGCDMVLVPTIVSVDAPLTNMIAVRVDKTVQYVGDIFPEKLLIDYDLIRKAPPELNRACACDIASIHTALFDWKLAHDHTGEAYHPDVAHLARQCLDELDRNADEVYRVTDKGIDTIVDLFCREVEFCARIGSSRPEEGAEHLVAYNLEHITRRHFLHGDLVGLGIFTVSRLQENAPEWAADLIRRCGLRYTAPDAAPEEIAQALRTLKTFKDNAGYFYSVVDTEPITEDFIQDTLDALCRS
ncbi:MAG TPA: iron-containing alcohol dehydrogenase [Candidatus Hydrogenedentes bacterium]|nr:iron-containing alcohol dehydrogenase [Candidatus Hydrogenedentota bacterium]